MLGARTLEEILSEARTSLDSHGQDYRLVSVIFAPESSGVYAELGESRERLDLLTGVRWDLFWAGYFHPPGGSEVDEWEFHGDRFRAIADALSAHHKAAIAAAAELSGDGAAGLGPRMTEPFALPEADGASRVVHFLVYEGNVDWAGLLWQDVDDRLGGTAVADLAKRGNEWPDQDSPISQEMGVEFLDGPISRQHLAFALEAALVAVWPLPVAADLGVVVASYLFSRRSKSR